MSNNEYLQSIQLKNFMQFHDVKCAFKQNLNLIIGHNGEGKSNLLRSIQLLLKHTDNIENCISTIENAQQAEISGRYGEQNITRVILPTGYNFIVNDKQVSKNKEESVINAPILAIEQSKADQLAKMSPEQLFNEFQKTVGVKDYEQKKQDIQNQLDITCKKRQQCEDFLDEFSEKVEELKEKASDYDEFLQYQAKIKDLEARLKKCEIIDIRQQIIEQENQKVMLSKNYVQVQNEIKKDNESLSSINSQIEEQQIQIATLTIEVEKLKDIFSKLLEYGYKDGDDNVAQIDINQKNQRYSQLDQLISEQNIELIKLQQSIENSKSKMSKGQIEAEINILHAESPQLAQNLQRLSYEYEQQSRLVQEIGAKGKEIEKQINLSKQYPVQQLQSDLNNLILKHERLNRRKNDNMIQVQKSMDDLFSQYPQKVTYAIKYLQNMPGYIGMFGELIQVSSVLFNVLENAAGGLLMQIVVDKNSNAMKMIANLQQQSKTDEQLKGVKINFLIAEEFQDSTKNISFQTQIQSQDNASVLSLAIQSDDRVKGIVEAYFGRVLVVRTFSLANQFAQQYNSDCYTMDGDCVLTNGLVNAGYHSATKVKYFYALQSAKSDFNETQQAINQMEGDMRELQDKISGYQGEIARNEAEILKQQQSQTENIRTLNNEKEKQHSLHQQLFEAQQLSKNNEFRLQSLQDILYSQQSQKIDEKQVKQQINLLQNNIKINIQEQKQISEEITKYNEEKIESQSHANFYSEIKRQYNIQENMLNSFKMKIEQNSQNLIENGLKIKELTKQEQEIKAQVDDKNQILLTIASDNENLGDQIILKYNEISKLEHSVLEIESSYKSQDFGHGNLIVRSDMQTQLQVYIQQAKQHNSSNSLIYETYKLQNDKLEDGKQELEQLTKAEEEINNMITNLEEKHKTELISNFGAVNESFIKFYKYLTGDEAYLEMKGKTLSVKAAKDTKQLSGGQLAARSLALLFAFNATDSFSIMILDESDANLDQQTRINLAHLIQEKCKKEGMQAFVTSFKKEMLQFSDGVYCIQNGQILEVTEDEISEGIWGE